MFPTNIESWVFVSIACLIGFAIGQWLKIRRKKTKTNSDYVDGLKKRILAETRGQKKKTKKKNRRVNRKNGGA
ncbi:hypothetical protein D4S03_00060 [bacterium]|nr:MAG: hypothetical protein D4S03_00060 [bacterium]